MPKETGQTDYKRDQEIKPPTPSTPPRLRYRARDTWPSPTKVKAITTLPTKSAIHTLWELNTQFADLGDKINACIISIYSYVTSRDYVENQSNFHAHIAATGVYEATYNQLLHGKDHNKKAATIFNKIRNILVEVNEQIESVPDNITLLNWQAWLTIQHDIFVTAFLAVLHLKENRAKEQNTNEDLDFKNHLKDHCNIDLDSLTVIVYSDEMRIRFQKMHPPALPDVEKIPFEEQKTPKKLQPSCRRSIRALFVNEPPFLPTKSSIALVDLNLPSSVSEPIMHALKIHNSSLTKEFQSWFEEEKKDFIEDLENPKNVENKIFSSSGVK